MADETPPKKKPVTPPQARVSRKPAGPHDTDRYYRHKNVSAVRNSASDSTRKPGERPKPIPTPKAASGDRGTDHIYRSGGVKTERTKPSPAPAKKKSISVSEVTPLDVNAVPPVTMEETQRTKQCVVDSTFPKTKVNELVDAICSVLNSGCGFLLKVHQVYAMKFRTALELKVGQEIITEDQLRDVKIVVFKAETRKTEEILGEPEADATVPVTVNSPDASVEDMLAGIEEEDRALEQMTHGAVETPVEVECDIEREAEPEKELTTVTTEDVGDIPPDFFEPAKDEDGSAVAEEPAPIPSDFFNAPEVPAEKTPEEVEAELQAMIDAEEKAAVPEKKTRKRKHS